MGLGSGGGRESYPAFGSAAEPRFAVTLSGVVDLIARLRGLVRSPALAIAVLIAANAIPIFGVLFLGWDAFALLVLYWIESGVVGLVNVLKIATAEGPLMGSGSGLGLGAAIPGSTWIRGAPARPGAGHAALRSILVAFFLLHYGFFWLIHGVFVFVALPLFAGAATIVSRGERLAPGELPLVPVIETQGLLLAAFVLLVSHLISFWVNFIKRGEFRNVSPMAQTVQPYARVFVLHLVIVFGGVVVFVVGQPIALLILLVVLKTGLDVVLHIRAHRRAQAPPPVVC